MKNRHNCFTLILLFTLNAFSGYTQSKDTPEYMIDVLFVYPESVIEHDLAFAQIQDIVDGANVIYANSNVNFRMNVADVFASDMNEDEAGQFGHVILNIPNPGTVDQQYQHYREHPAMPKFKEVFDRRAELKADIVIFHDYPQTGVAGAGGNNMHEAYVRIPWSERGTNKLVHEAGHVMGLTHEHGTSIPYDSDLRSVATIMSVNCANFDADMNDTNNRVDLLSGSNNYHDTLRLYSPCSWNSADILNERAADISQWGESYETTPYKNKIYPNRMTEVSQADNCISWAIDDMQRLFRWNGYEWEHIISNLRFRDVEASSSEKVFLVNTDGDLYTYSLKDSEFKKRAAPAPLMRIANSQPNNTKACLTSTGKVYIKDNSEWIELTPPDNIYFVDIDLQQYDKLWAVGSNRTLYRWNSERGDWKVKTSIPAVRVSAGNDGTILMLSEEYKIYVKYPGEKFSAIQNNVPAHCNLRENHPYSTVEILDGKATGINAYNRERIWVVSSGYIYKYSGGNGFQKVYEMFEPWQKLAVSY